jgi:hypothetical protein
MVGNRDGRPVCRLQRRSTKLFSSAILPGDGI